MTIGSIIVFLMISNSSEYAGSQPCEGLLDFTLYRPGPMFENLVSDSNNVGVYVNDLPGKSCQVPGTASS